MPNLYGVNAKRNRAEHHLELIEQFISAFFDSDPYPIMTESHPDEGVYLARLVYPKKLDTRRLALMIGDCIHNMRSALDYIAWELAGSDIADRETMFPIYDTPDGFARLGKKRIKRLSAKAQTLIEWLQPYDTGHGGKQLALSAINNIDTADKHKLLTVAIAIAEQVTCDFGIPGQPRAGGKLRHRLRIFDHAPLVHDAVIADWTLDPPLKNVQVNFKFTPQVEFGDIHGFPTTHAFVVPNLKIMLESVDKVVKRFKKDRFFPS